MHFPTVMGAVVLTYNLAGVSTSLRLTPEAIAGIFLGKVTKWNDPALTAANPTVSLPTRTTASSGVSSRSHDHPACIPGGG